MKKLLGTKRLLAYSLLGVLGTVSLSSNAGGFQLFEESVSGMGNAYAGSGATADDASTEFYNPAGMTLLKKPEISVAGTALDLDINADVKKAENTTSNQLQPIPVTTPVNGATNISPGGWSFIPAMHFVYPGQKWAFGFGVTAPYGLQTDYPDDSAARFLATTSKLQVINIGPNVAYQLTPKLSVGVGFDAQYLTANLDQREILSLLGNSYESNFTNKGNDWAYGWNAGLMYQISSSTRVGFSYRSQVDHTIKGDASLSNLPNAPIDLSSYGQGSVTAPFILPQSADLSLYHDINSKWAILTSLDYTNWKKIKNLTLNYTGQIANIIQSATIPLNFRDTWRYSVGLNYRPTAKWLFRTGLAYDQSPVPNAESRTYRLPDSDRIWASLGARYQVNKAFSIDAGYAHLFVKDSDSTYQQTIGGTIQSLIPVKYAILNSAYSHFNSSVNEFGLQLNWKFD